MQSHKHCYVDSTACTDPWQWGSAPKVSLCWFIAISPWIESQKKNEIFLFQRELQSFLLKHLWISSKIWKYSQWCVLDGFQSLAWKELLGSGNGCLQVISLVLFLFFRFTISNIYLCKTRIYSTLFQCPRSSIDNKWEFIASITAWHIWKATQVHPSQIGQILFIPWWRHGQRFTGGPKL